ncbi:hypothetical protein V8C86DRAFT_3138287 [Haematococcus lacustris]
MSNRRQPSLLGRIAGSKAATAILAVGGICTLALGPVLYRVKYAPKLDPDQSRPRSAAMRGAYVNSGSLDIGPDKPISSFKD